jgi:RNA polymerase sigma-70 factor, ECF subfamily
LKSVWAAKLGKKSVDECAHILSIPAATVKTRMFYARKKLAELVKDA